MIPVGYIILFLIMASIILKGYHSLLMKIGMDAVVRRRRVLYAGLGIAAWIAYVTAMSFTGFLEDFNLPPRLLIFIILPQFIFIAVLLYRNRRSRLLAALPKSWPVYYQSFRIVVELLFLGTFLYYPHIVPVEGTFEGYNYEILVGLSAPIVGALAFGNKILSEKVVFAWNIWGLLMLCIIIGIFLTATAFPHLWGSEESLVGVEFTRMPYILVAGFLMPSAVMMHFLSIMTLLRK